MLTEQLKMMSSRTYWALIAVIYVSIVRILRYRRRKQVSNRFKDNLTSMTLDDAFTIQRNLGQLEFPRIFSASLLFALFTTYEIPSISRVLASTRELSSGITTSKRAADTGVLLTEVVLNMPASTRAIDGIARINFLHSGYRKAGKISDDDMLYTLSLFSLEPIRWVARYDWRTLTDVERCAIGVFWKDLGESMEIPYDKLGTIEGGGLSWLDALDAWSSEYESNHLKPAETNVKVSRATLDVVLFNVPTKLKTFAIGLVSSFLEPRLRQSIRYDLASFFHRVSANYHDPRLQEPERMHRVIFETVITVRKFAVRYLCPPRPEWMRVRRFTDTPDPKTGRYHSLRYSAHPWYFRPNPSAQWRLASLRSRIMQGQVSSDSGAEYHPEGYLISELGPESMKGKSVADMNKTRQALRDRRLAGCPF